VIPESNARTHSAPEAVDSGAPRSRREIRCQQNRHVGLTVKTTIDRGCRPCPPSGERGPGRARSAPGLPGTGRPPGGESPGQASPGAERRIIRAWVMRTSWTASWSAWRRIPTIPGTVGCLVFVGGKHRRRLILPRRHVTPWARRRSSIVFRPGIWRAFASRPSASTRRQRHAFWPLELARRRHGGA